MSDWDIFVAALAYSRPAVHAVNEYLWGEGIEAEIQPEQVAPCREAADRYRDNGDIYALIDGKRERIEVRRLREVRFAGADEWPYPLVMVSQTYQWDEADPKPHSYFICSADLKCAALVNVRESYPHWLVTHFRNSLKQRDEHQYSVPRAHARFVELPRLVGE